MFWCDLPRDAVRLSGPDAASYLQSQVSQELRSLQVGASAWAFLLQPTGKVDVLLRVWRAGEEEFVLDTDAGYGEVLVQRLNRFKIRVKADLTPVTMTFVAVRPEAGEEAVLSAAAVGGTVLVGWGGGFDLVGDERIVPAGVRQGDAADLLVARIAAVWPAMGAEIVPGETIPAETGITAAAVSFTKGCYPGQELVERMDSRSATAPRTLPRHTAAEAEAVGARITTRVADDVLAYVPRSAQAR